MSRRESYTRFYLFVHDGRAHGEPDSSPTSLTQTKEATDEKSVLAVDDQVLQEFLAQGDIPRVIDAIARLAKPKSPEDPRTKPHRAARLLIQAIRDASMVHGNLPLAVALAEELNKPDIRKKLSKNEILTTGVAAVFIALNRLKGYKNPQEQEVVVAFLTERVAEDSKITYPEMQT